MVPTCHTAMLLTGGLTGLWIFALLTLHSARLGEPQIESLNEPDVPFPPAQPTAQNLDAICHHGHGRPRYPASFFPHSRVSHFRHRGRAFNRLESWFRLCCSGLVAQQSIQMLCCTLQAWEKALSKFCDEEFNSMTFPYVCCKEDGDARWTCFNRDLPNPNWDPTEGYTAPSAPKEPGFTFNTSAC